MTNQRTLDHGAAPAARPAVPSAARRVLGNSAWLIASEGATRVVSLATLLYLSRTLAPSGMGSVQFGLAVFMLLQLVCIGGTETLLTREAARAPSDMARLAGRSLLLAWSQLAVAFGVVVGGMWALGMPSEMRQSGILFGMAAAVVPASFRFAFLAGERARVIGLGTFAGYAAFLVLCVASVRHPDDVARVGWAWIAGMSIRTAVQLLAFLREHGRLVFDTSAFAAWLRRTAAVGAGSIARGLMLTMDVLVLGLFRPADEVALYGLAIKVPLFFGSLATLFYTALFPTIARDVAGDTGRVGKIGAETVEIVLGVMLPGALCLGLVAEPLVLALFTERYREASPLLGVLVWRLPLMAAGGVYRTVLWAKNPGADARVSVQVVTMTFVALLAVAGTAGATGVAWTMLAGDAIGLVLNRRAGRPRAGMRVRPEAVVRLGAASALAGGLMLVVPRHAGIATVAGALVAWTVSTLVADLPYARRLVAELSHRGTP
jgi:O-antigen/teichoic acid export membrane protein